MRNPRLWRNLALALVAAGPVAIAIALQLPEGVDDNAVRAMAFNFGFIAIIFGACAALFLHMGIPKNPTIAAVAGDGQPVNSEFFHGRGDGSNPEDLSECWACGFTTHEFIAQCPKCGETMQSRRWSRRLGVALIVCGVIITTMMLVMLYLETPVMLNPGVEIDGSTFTGSAQMGLSVIALFSVLLAFGVTSLLYGAWQVKTGRRSKKVVTAMVTVVSVLMCIGWLVRNFGS